MLIFIITFDAINFACFLSPLSHKPGLRHLYRYLDLHCVYDRNMLFIVAFRSFMLNVACSYFLYVLGPFRPTNKI